VHTGRQLLWLIAGRVGLLAASMASMHTATRVLGPQEMGTLNLVLATIGAVALPVAGCSHFFYRQAMAWHIEGSLHANLRRYAASLAAAGALAAAATLILPPTWWPAPAGWLALLLAGNLVIVTLQQALLHLLNLAGQRLRYVVLGNLVAWGGVACADAAVHWRGPLAVHWMAGLLAVQFIALLLATAMLPKAAVKSAPFAAEPYAPRAVLSFAWPLVLCLSFYWLQRSLPLPWLAAQADATQVGLFSVAFSVGMLAMLSFDTLFKELYGPRYEREIAHAAHAARVAAWERYAAAFLPGLMAACMCTVAAAPALLMALTAPAFHGLALFVGWGAVCQAILSVYSLVMLQATSVMDNRALLLPNACGALLTALVLWRGGASDASTQAALATATGLLATTVLAAWRLRRVHAARWPWQRSVRAAAAGAPVLAATHLTHPVLALLGVTAFAVLLQWWLSRVWWTQEPA
jgi:O-antigen/teichoic acid export membrane protein